MSSSDSMTAHQLDDVDFKDDDDDDDDAAQATQPLSGRVAYHTQINIGVTTLYICMSIRVWC